MKGNENNHNEGRENGREGKEQLRLPEGRLRVGITHGDYNGVGYEVILKMLDDQRMLELCIPIVYGSAKIAQFYRKGLELTGPQWVQVADASQARTDAVSIVNVIDKDAQVNPGQESPEAGQAALAALEAAVTDLKSGVIDVLVTAPINKHSMQSDTFRFPGHTEYLAASSEIEGAKPLMILFSDTMRVALATTHLPVTKLSEALTIDLILDKLQAFNLSLTKDFSIVKPRIAVLALNPHAGEEGLLGSEEQQVIIPAIEQAREAGIHAFGPYAADGFFGNGLYKKFDGILAMYHDQGLAPFKALAMNAGVNFTAGLEFVRTSPDHGTAADIAGKGIASPDSMRQALYAALDIYRSRANHDEMTSSPLPKRYHDRSRDN